MADAAVDFLLNNLKELAIHHGHLITNAKSEIESLQIDLRLFKAFLEQSVKKRRKDEPTYKVLVQNIRDVVYEVEDVIDEYVTKATERKAGSLIHRIFKSPVDLHDIGSKVEGIKERVKRAMADLDKLGVNNEDKHEKPEVRPPRQKDVVGFEDVTEELKCRLTKETNHFDVVSLIGMFGLGKTTLAWKIFNDKAIEYEFLVRIWIVVSQELSEKNIFLAILEKFTTITEDYGKMEAWELIPIVAGYLERCSSFLIVFDDVWSPAHWDKICQALPSTNNKGKVLITSREVDVGTHASKNGLLKKLRFFTQEESWELLRLEALGKLHRPSSELEGVGRRIARDCEGLPLAIVIIGGILATKFSASDESGMIKEWKKVSERVSAYLLDDKQNDLAARMKNFISLSYDRLPDHLRTCFLYMGMFPEDYEIPASKLIHMWIAEGFIQQNDYSTLEETGEMYLDDLINRNLIKIEKMKSDGKVKTCRIHDTLRDFCRTEAGNGNENLFQEIKFNNGVFAPPDSELQKCRRLYIHSNCLRFISEEPTVPRVRSFVYLSKDEFTLPEENISDFLEAFRLLRVLDIEPILFPKITSDIFRLVHVKYLAVSLNLSFLPSKFSQLWNLQTLIVNTASDKLAVEADIWKMKQLRHFKTNVSATLPKPSKKESKQGAQLQTLSTVSVESCTADLFDRACNLKKLGIRGRLALLMEGKMASFDSLRKMEYLEKLKLINDVRPKPASEGKLHSPPQPNQFPSKLRSLTLASTFLDWSYMSTLGQLENLEVLKLKDKAIVGSEWKAFGDGFRRLEFLLIEETDLATWDPSNHHFPSLKGLVLKNCKKLLGIPIGLADVASFQMLELFSCKSASSSARKIQEAKTKIQAEGSAFKLTIFPPTE
ncbi:hypothetical protein C2S53_000572 [Perilla frutescens var. hirtella]|uniref:Uncharacterized protein n=1 Tax=Perilla frutescens var. hirtella TaxID=608512 RepID=A0AAD4IQ93_PERFH|nr:hypothetical protein C2S53_000572 [Perilla frutescens var. hirtella]